MALTDEQIEALAKKHGATSYRNRADTQHPAYGFTPAGLLNLLAEVRKQDTELIRQMLEGIEAETSHTWECNSYHPKLYAAIAAARARLENT